MNQTLSSALRAFSQLDPATPDARSVATLDLLKRILGADSVILSLFDKETESWWAPLAAGAIEPTLLESQFLMFALSSRQSLFYEDPQPARDIDAHLMERERIRSFAVAPLVVDGETLGVLSINYRVRHEFTSEERNMIQLLAAQLALALRVTGLDDVTKADLVAANILRFQTTLPSLLTPSQYAEIVSTILAGIEYIYSVLAAIEVGGSLLTAEMVGFASQDTLTPSTVRTVLAAADIDPVMIVAARYGSPASFDLLGIGKVLEVLRDIVTDVFWRGKHEKQLAELKRQSQEEDIATTRIQREQLMVEVLAKKLDVIAKAKDLPLSDNDKQLLISALLPHVRAIGHVVPSQRRRSRPRGGSGTEV